MDTRILVLLLLLLLAFLQICNIAAVTDSSDVIVLETLKKESWQNSPPSWVAGTDPCENKWEGIVCNNNSRVISIILPGRGLAGTLSGDITNLPYLQQLDLSQNKDLGGPLPASIGDLKNLETLTLTGCSFSGHIPDSIGSLQKLKSLYLNSNSFNGPIPPSTGNLSALYLLDLAENELEGPIPVSTGTSTTGLDMLINTAHFHFGKNRLSGAIPPELFKSDMKLIHMLFEDNNLYGDIPDTLGLVKTLEVLRLDRNSLTGRVPVNLNNLTNVRDLFLYDNRLTGPIPNLTGMNVLTSLDMSNNNFDASEFPTWIPSLQSLIQLTMEGTNLQGQIPTSLFKLPLLTTVKLGNNSLNGTLDIGTSNGKELNFIDLRNNEISDYKEIPGLDVILANNPTCKGIGATKSYCSIKGHNFSYTTPNNCATVHCNSDQSCSPNGRCAHPYEGKLVFKSPSFLPLKNSTFEALQRALMTSFSSNNVAVDSISLIYMGNNPSEYREVRLEVFPISGDHFDQTVTSRIVVAINDIVPIDTPYGPFELQRINDQLIDGQQSARSNNSSNTSIIIGAATASSALVLLLLLAGAYAYRQKKRAQRATEQSNPFAHWDSSKRRGANVPQLKGARCFSFEELKRCTNGFSDDNYIGRGSFGKVYKGTLPDGQLIAVKRAQQGSLQGGPEFKSEIELLSRVHHKNLVSLLGFCIERGEEILVYEFAVNGCLSDILSGKTGIRMDWVRRLKVALGSAKGLAYMHELANPPIIHRDIKSTNILLDERLTVKVADFGLSKPMSNGSEMVHVSTQVKGTMGYLDPEYYMTQKLTEKSDVYSFGVVMLEMLTGRRPIERGKYIVREVKTAIDMTKDLYNLQELLDPNIGLETTLKGLDKFVDLAMKCVQQSAHDRPTMGDVVKEIENILKLAGLDPNMESASTLGSHEQVDKGSRHPYTIYDFDYSAGFPPSMVEPQ